MTKITLIHAPDDQVCAQELADALGRWGLSVELGTAAAERGPMLVLWTAASAINVEYLHAIMGKGGSKRVDISIGDIAPPAVGAIRLDGCDANNASDPNWLEMIDRLTMVAYGDPESTLTPVVTSVPAPAIEQRAPERKIAEPGANAQIAALPAQPTPIDISHESAPMPVSGDVSDLAVEPEDQWMLVWRGLPWVVAGAIAYVAALFVINPFIDVKAIGTPSFHSLGDTHDWESYLFGSIWTFLFLLPPLLYLKAKQRIGWLAVFLFILFITAAHAVAIWLAMFIPGFINIYTVIGVSDAKREFEDAAVLLPSLGICGLLGAVASFATFLGHPSQRRWDRLGFAGMCCVGLMLIAALSALFFGRDAIFTLALYPAWQIAFGLAMLHMFLTPMPQSFDAT